MALLDNNTSRNFDGSIQRVSPQSAKDYVDVISTPPKSGNLRDYEVYYEDADPKSKFFRIRKIPSVLASGKNYFLISGTDLLQPTTNVVVEVLDVKGKRLAVEIPRVLVNGTDRAVVIVVYPTDYYGDCIITVLGEAIDVPNKWKGNYNVRWQTTVLCNPSIDNDDDAIFANSPTIEYQEIYDTQGNITKLISDKTVFNQGLMYSRIAGEKLSPLMTYQLYLVDGVSPSTNSNFDTLDSWYTGSPYVDNAYVSSNKLYVSQSYGLFGITLGVTQSIAMKAYKKYTLQADFMGSESNLAGSVASAMICSGSDVLLYLYSTASTDISMFGEFSSSVDISASIELGGQAFALMTVWANVSVEDYVTGSNWGGFTKDMEGGVLEVSESNMVIYPRTPEYLNKTYTSYISKVISSHLAIANSSYQAYNTTLKVNNRVEFISGSYSLNYGKIEYIGSDNVKNSYLKLNFRNLSTIVGSLKYIDLYKNPGNNYIGRYPIVAHDMLISGSSFTQSADFTNNWILITSGSYDDRKLQFHSKTHALD